MSKVSLRFFICSSFKTYILPNIMKNTGIACRLIKPRKPLIINSWCCYFQIMMYIIVKCPRKQTNWQKKLASHANFPIYCCYPFFFKTPGNPEWGKICVLTKHNSSSGMFLCHFLMAINKAYVKLKIEQHQNNNFATTLNQALTAMTLIFFGC